MSDLDRIASQFDAPWKIALESFLEPFMAFCFPAVHQLIDWGVPPVFLDTELQQIAPDHEDGRRAVDKLVRVRLRDGREEWVLVHVEVQAQHDETFAERMWVYYYRIWDRFAQRTISLAVLADDQKNWRPEEYRRELGGCSLEFRFPVFKVMDSPDPEGEFERTGNLFALLVAAHQVGLATRKNPEERSAGRFRVVRHLYRHGLDREEVLRLFRLIEWLTLLPKDWELRFREKWASFEGSKDTMTIDTLLSPLEVMLLEESRQEGRREAQVEVLRTALTDALEARFGAEAAGAIAQAQTLSDEAVLRRTHRLAVTSPNLQSFLAATTAAENTP